MKGPVDLAFESSGGFTVVDFKTDRAEGELQESYARQVQLYAEAIAQATGKPARAGIDECVSGRSRLDSTGLGGTCPTEVVAGQDGLVGRVPRPRTFHRRGPS
jgi:hypothetical protein